MDVLKINDDDDDEHSNKLQQLQWRPRQRHENINMNWRMPQSKMRLKSCQIWILWVVNFVRFCSKTFRFCWCCRYIWDVSGTKGSHQTLMWYFISKQVEYLFTDKTGTLTENDMHFCQCSVDGVIYEESRNQLFVQSPKSSMPVNSMSVSWIIIIRSLRN